MVRLTHYIWSLTIFHYIHLCICSLNKHVLSTCKVLSIVRWAEDTGRSRHISLVNGGGEFTLTGSCCFRLGQRLGDHYFRLSPHPGFMDEEMRRWEDEMIEPSKNQLYFNLPKIHTLKLSKLYIIWKTWFIAPISLVAFWGWEHCFFHKCLLS